MAIANSVPGDILSDKLTVEPLQAGNWDSLVRLFGDRGPCDNCWCMYYRLTNADFKAGKVEGGNRKALHGLAMQDKPTGLIGFYDGQPVAWCAFAPREHFSRLGRSRVHKRIDDLPVWSIPCLFVDKKLRGKGLTVLMLHAVIRYAREKGIRVLEAYPLIPSKRYPDAFAWVGLYSAFEKTGFKVVDRTSKNRPMVRFYLE